jgi:hypothetical protein
MAIHWDTKFGGAGVSPTRPLRRGMAQDAGWGHF